MADSEEVNTFMQKASKMTRSYFVNANALKGFLVPYSIVRYLKKAEENQELLEVTEHQKIDMQVLLE